MNTQINPGELALASIGLSPLLKDDMPKIGLGRLDEIARIPKQIEKLASKVCDGTLTYQPYEHEHSYKKLLDRLSRPLTHDEIVKLIDRFPQEASDIATAFSVEVQLALKDLRDIFPVSVYRTFAGPKNLEPNADLVFKFSNRLDVVNNPLRVFPLIATGALLKSQAQIVRQIYPTLSAAIDEALYAATAKHRADGSTLNPYQLPPRAEMGVATWLGQRRISYKAPALPAPAPQDPKSNPSKLATPVQATMPPQRQTSKAA